MPADWFSAQVTLPNIVMVLSAASGIGGYITAFRGLERRVATMETTFLRKDVQEAVLISINQRLTNIESDVRELRNQ